MCTPRPMVPFCGEVLQRALERYFFLLLVGFGVPCYRDLLHACSAGPTQHLPAKLLLSVAGTLPPGLGGGGDGPEAKKKNCVPKIGLKFLAHFTNFPFSLRTIFLMWVGG